MTEPATTKRTQRRLERAALPVAIVCVGGVMGYVARPVYRALTQPTVNELNAAHVPAANSIGSVNTLFIFEDFARGRCRRETTSLGQRFSYTREQSTLTFACEDGPYETDCGALEGTALGTIVCRPWGDGNDLA